MAGVAAPGTAATAECVPDDWLGVCILWSWWFAGFGLQNSSFQMNTLRPASDLACRKLVEKSAVDGLLHQLLIIVD